MNKCTSCSRDFTSIGAFDRHRTGPFNGERRCMTEQEMRAHNLELNPASDKWQVILTAEKKAQIKRLNSEDKRTSQSAIFAVAS